MNTHPRPSHRIATLCLGLLVFLLSATSVQAKEIPPRFDPVLSLRGNCGAPAVDPVADPSCTGEPLAYPPAPNRPTPFERPIDIAVDPHGNLYFYDEGGFGDDNERIAVFDDEGRFLTELSLPPERQFVMSIAVDSEGELYVWFDGGGGNLFRYSPTVYEPNVGKIAYADPPQLVVGPVSCPCGGAPGSLAVDAANDHVYFAADKKVVELSSAAEGNATIGAVDLGIYWTNRMAVDAQRRRVFVSYCSNGNAECSIKVLAADPPYQQIGEIDGSNTPAGDFFADNGWLSPAVDEETGDVFILDNQAQAAYQFDENYEYLSTANHPLLAQGRAAALSNGAGAANRHTLFLTTYEGARILAFRPQSISVPTVSASVSGLSETEATLEAQIDPGGAVTTYSVEYTTQTAFEANAFAAASLASAGTVPGAGLPVKVSAPLSDLSPSTTYRFRVSAENEAGPAAPLTEGNFTTYADSPAVGDCPNFEARSGISASLPDCRAYELVTPPETTGRTPQGVLPVQFPTQQSSPSGEALSFRIEGGALPGFNGVGSFSGDPYLALRGPSGWTTTAAGPTGAEVSLLEPEAIAAGQGYSFWSGRGEGSLVIHGPTGDPLTRYLRYPDGHSELVGRGSLGSDPRAIGLFLSPHGEHVIFITSNVSTKEWQALRLEPASPAEGTEAIYDRTIDPLTGAEQTHVVSLLPGGVTPGQPAVYEGASSDGEGIAFSLGAKLYLRLHNQTTYEIGENVAFAGVSTGGERTFYLQAGDLKAFDTSTEEVIEFTTTGDATPVNVASGGARAYFLSPSALGEANPEGADAVPPATGTGSLGAKGTGTLSAAKGTGTLATGSPELTGLSVSEGAFQVGMQITGTGIPDATTIKALGPGILTLSKAATASGATPLAAGSTTITGLSSSEGAFQVGMQITGTGIPDATTIKALGPGILTLSKAATQPGPAVALSAGSTLITGVSAGAGAFRVGMSITATGIPAGTVITALDEGAHTLTLSQEAAASGAQPLSAFAQNLYLSTEGQLSFIATVTDDDAKKGLGRWTQVVTRQPALDPSRTNPDGSVLLFESRAEITGYPASDFPQIYRYDSPDGRLHCISCIPTGTPATGGAGLQSYAKDEFDPTPLSPSSYVPNLTPDGERAFFDSTEALLSTDTDGVRDVYEWEEEGVGSCRRPGGCVYLISSGKSAVDNYLYGHSSDGSDVFFATTDLLSPEDPSGTFSIYDARVGGGLSAPVTAGECLGEACQPIAAAPGSASLASSTFRGGGNPASQAGKARCPKGKRQVTKLGKTRCLKKRKHKGKGAKPKRGAANRSADR